MINDNFRNMDIIYFITHKNSSTHYNITTDDISNNQEKNVIINGIY